MIMGYFAKHSAEEMGENRAAAGQDRTGRQMQGVAPFAIIVGAAPSRVGNRKNKATKRSKLKVFR
jgi:hypothetical protein